LVFLIALFGQVTTIEQSRFNVFKGKSETPAACLAQAVSIRIASSAENYYLVVTTARQLDMVDTQEVMTLSEVANYLRVHPSTIYRLLRDREIPAFKLGRDWRFSRDQVDQWCRERDRAYRSRKLIF
jgi:excisionase family DNA binding protein